MIDASKLVECLKSENKLVRDSAMVRAKNLSRSDMNELIEFTKALGGMDYLSNLIMPDRPAPAIAQAAKPPSNPSKSYGIYTVGDSNFFPGIVAAINSLRYYECQSPVAVIDIGFEPWMKEFLQSYKNVQVLDIKPIKDIIRFTDVLTDDNPVMKGWAYKAFAIVYYNIFETFTFIDADFLPLCNLENELRPLAEQGLFVSTEDGANKWEAKHTEAVGVLVGSYMNINAGFITMDVRKYNWLLHEWRNLMTRRKPFDLWYGDQGALNVVMDKYKVPKHVIDKNLWNQTWLNEKMAKADNVGFGEENSKEILIHKDLKRRIYAWHGTGWHKLWHQIGIDHFRPKQDERVKFYQESQGKSPKAVVEMFRKLLFSGGKLRLSGHLLTNA